MFTGIVEACVAARSFTALGQGARLVLPAPAPDWSVAPGDSVAVAGCCLTVAALEPRPQGAPDMAFDLSSETLARTWFGELAAGRRVNLERAVRLADRLGGHLVSGHVDGVGHVVASVDTRDGGRELSFEVPAELERYVIEKGSIAIDGVSLTVVQPRGARFHVALIPVTLERTTLGEARPGTRVHIEADLIGKWIEKLLEARR